MKGHNIMMDMSDAMFDSTIPMHIRHGLLDYTQMEDGIYAGTKILKRTAENDDVNGSQHSSTGGTDFTYEDATAYDVSQATSVGYYEYFSDYGFGTYTGHYYHGSDEKFAAIVIDPPSYAIAMHL